MFIERKLRAFYPWPGIFTYLKDKKLNILESKVYKGSFSSEDKSAEAGKVIGIDKNEGILVQTGDGILSIQMLQLASKKALFWKSFINGINGIEGIVLGGK